LISFLSFGYLSDDRIRLFTIYVPKADDLACCCSDVTITLCFMGSLGIILTGRCLAVILKESL